MKKYLLLFLTLSSFAAIQAMDVVRDGKPCAEIVLDAKAPQGEKLAAKDLQMFLEKISGAKLEIVNASTGKFTNHLFVGESVYTKKLNYQLPEFQNSGYDILIGKDYAVLNGPSTLYPPLKFESRQKGDLEKYQEYVGGKYDMFCFDHGGGKFRKSVGIFASDDIGSFHAVSALLESLGVRFYAPYEDGTVIPKTKDIVLKEGRITKEAAYGRRDWYHPGDEAEGHLWLKRMKCGVRSGIVFNHTTRNFLRNPDNQKLYPNWYSEDAPGHFIPGTQNQGGIPRYVDPGFQEVCANWAGKLLDTYPQLSAVTCGAPDGAHSWDYRDREKYFTPGLSDAQATANLFWDFHVAIAEKLKKTHPEKKLIWFSRSKGVLPTNVNPKQIPDNIIFPCQANSPSELVLEYRYKELISRPAAVEKLFGKTAKSPAWEWWLDYRYTYSPRYPIFFPETLQKYRQAMRPYCDGCFMEIPGAGKSEGAKGNTSQLIGSAKISAPMMYINNKLFWDPDLDMKALLDEYYKLYFGPAEKEMRNFFDFAREVWARPESRSVTSSAGFLKEKDVDKFFKLLAAAKAKCPEDSFYFRRVDALEKGYAPLEKLFASLKRQGPLFRLNTAPDKEAPDGDLNAYRVWLPMMVNRTAEDVRKNRTEASVQLTNDRKYLWIAVRCYELKMDKLEANCTKHDDNGIFSDDLVEVYLDSPERSYFKIAVNSNGVLFDTSTDVSIITRDTLPDLWESGTKVCVEKYDDRWEMEMKIPTEDFGKLGPTRQYPWGINICRTRIADLGVRNQRCSSIAPTGDSFKLQKCWGQIWAR